VSLNYSEFLLLFHSQRRHKEGQKAIIREVLLPLGSKPEISFQWGTLRRSLVPERRVPHSCDFAAAVNGKQRVYDPREVSPDEVLWDLKFIRDKMDIDLVADKEKKPKRAKKKDKVK